MGRAEVEARGCEEERAGGGPATMNFRAISMLLLLTLAVAAWAAAPANKPPKKAAAKKAPRGASARSATSAVSASTRAEAHQGVEQKVSRGADIPVENAVALVPFFEQLYR